MRYVFACRLEREPKSRADLDSLIGPDCRVIFFIFHRTNDLTQKLEKGGPFECDELEKALSRKREMLSNYSTCSIHDGKRKVQFFVSGAAACYPTDEKSIADDK